MSTDDSKSDFISSSKDITVSEDLQSSSITVKAVVSKDSHLVVSTELKRTPVVRALGLDETSGAASNANRHTSKESAHSATTNLTEETSASSPTEESGDSATSLLKTGEETIRKVSISFRVIEDTSGNAAAGTSSDLTTPTRVAGENELPEFSIETANYRCCPEHRGLYGYFRIKMMHFRESKYLFLFQVALLAMPIVSGLAGARNIYRCPASPAIAILFFMMGILGTLFLSFRIYSCLKKAHFPNSSWTDPNDGFPYAGLLLLIILFTTELACFFNMEPEFSPTRSSAKFCDEKFYYFAAWMNSFGIALVILALIVHCPGLHTCTNTNVRRVTHEQIRGLDH